MSKSRELYYLSVREYSRGKIENSEMLNTSTDYINELEEQNKEVLDYLISIYKDYKLGCAGFASLTCKNLIEKITGKSIDEVLKDE